MVASGYVLLWNILLRFQKDVFLLAARSTIDMLYIFQLLTVIRKRQGDYKQKFTPGGNFFEHARTSKYLKQSKQNRELKQATLLSTRTSAGSQSRRYRWRVMASAVLV